MSIFPLTQQDRKNHRTKKNFRHQVVINNYLWTTQVNYPKKMIFKIYH